MKLSDLFLFEKHNVLPPVHNPEGVNPALLTLGEYLQRVNGKGLSHDSGAYDLTLRQLNTGEYTHKKNYPILLKNIRKNGLAFQVRLRVEKRTYHRFDSEADDWIRDENGKLIPLDDKERQEKGYPEFEYTISIFNEDGEAVARTQDEWGAMLIMVAREYRGFGFGPLLIRLARTFEPMKPSGGFTPAGFRNFVKMHREIVRDALASGLYRTLIAQGQLTKDRAREIITSARLEIKPTKDDKFNLNTSDPKDWFVLAEWGGFTIYDRKLKDIYKDHLYEWGERFIKGHILVRVNEDSKGILVRFGGDTPRIKNFLVACAASYCAESNAVLMLDPEDLVYVDNTRYYVGREDWTTGFKRTPVRIKKPVNLSTIAKPDQMFRKSFDTYDEFKNAVLELADVFTDIET